MSDNERKEFIKENSKMIGKSFIELMILQGYNLNWNNELHKQIKLFEDFINHIIKKFCKFKIFL